MYIIEATPGGEHRMVATDAIGSGSIILEYSAHMCVLEANADIIRVQHSCIPNAAQYFHPNQNQMVLRALCHIPANEEIMIEYRPNIDVFLQPRKERMSIIRETTERKVVCLCDACTDPKNDGLRSQTWTILRKLADIPKFEDITDHHRHNALAEKLNLHWKYIQNLHQLRVRDLKLHDAYRLLQNFHQQVAGMCKSQEQGRRCAECCFSIDAATHTGEATSALESAIAVAIVCLGKEHHHVKNLVAEEEQLRGRVP